MDEFELNLELLKIHRRKSLFIQSAISIALTIITLLLILGIWWFKTSRQGEHSVRNVRGISKTTPPTAAENSFTIENAELRSKFRKTMNKTSKLPSDSLEGVNARIKLWRNFLGEHEKKHPNNANVKKARAILKHLEKVKVLYE